MKQKSVVIILGPPGSGKGTQAQLLSEKFNLFYLETSKILNYMFQEAKEEDYVEVEGKKYYLLKEKELFETGILCSPPFVTHITNKRIKELYDLGTNLVFAGSPRTLHEAERVIPQLKELYGSENIQIILINLPPEESIFRSTHRRICSLMRHPILYYEETKNLTICPLDGSKLITRKDDNTKVIKTRMKEYEKRTIPLLDYLKKEGYEIKEVAGRQTPVELHNDILKILG